MWERIDIIHSCKQKFLTKRSSTIGLLSLWSTQFKPCIGKQFTKLQNPQKEIDVFIRDIIILIEF